MYLLYIYIHTYVVGYSFITVVHILQFSITRYNIYNRQREKLEERGTLRWSILLIFPLHIVFDIPRKYFYFPCFKLFMGDGNYDCRLCTHYFNVFTVWSNRISLVGVWAKELYWDKWWWKLGFILEISNVLMWTL